MYHPNELIQDIQERLGRMVQDYRALIDQNQKLETENITLAKSLEEAIKQQEALKKQLDQIGQDTLRDTKGLDQWKAETRKDIKGIMKEVEKAIPQVESLLDKK